MPYLSVSTWSLHRLLGPLRWTAWDDVEKKHITEIEDQPELTKLLDLPKLLAEKGFKAVEICHFHFPRTDEEYLVELKTACKEANIRFYTLLLDYGDLSNEDPVRRNSDLQLMKDWIDIASFVGAERIRIVAGDAPAEDQEALKQTSQHLNELSLYAEERGVKVITENFKAQTSTSANCLKLVENSDGRINLIADFGNFTGDNKYDEIAKILPYSVSVHAKPQYDANGVPDADEFRRCLELLQEVNYEGPLSIIYDAPGDMWAGIERTRKVVEAYL